jgi:membrane protein required for colicin V production
MGTLDIIIIILLLWGAIIGFIHGFVVQILSLLALILGVWGGLEFSGLVARFLSNWITMSPTLLKAIAFALILIGVIVVVTLLAKLISDKIGKTSLNKWNRIGGVVFGMIKMAFISSVLIVIIERIDINRKLITSESVGESQLYKPVKKIAPLIVPHLNFDVLQKGIHDKA